MDAFTVVLAFILIGILCLLLLGVFMLEVIELVDYFKDLKEERRIQRMIDRMNDVNYRIKRIKRRHKNLETGALKEALTPPTEEAIERNEKRLEDSRKVFK